MSSSYKFICEKAKSGRSSCRGCKTAIDKGVLRVGVSVIVSDKEKGEINDDRRIALIEAARWYHPECLQMFRNSYRWWAENCPPLHEFVGFNTLDEQQKKILVQLLAGFKGETDEQPEEGERPTRKGRKKEIKDELDEEEGEEEEEKGQDRKQNKSRTKKEDTRKPKKEDSTKAGKIKREKEELPSLVKKESATPKQNKKRQKAEIKEEKADESPSSARSPKAQKRKLDVDTLPVKGRKTGAVKVSTPTKSVTTDEPVSFAGELKDLNNKDKQKIVELIEQNKKKSMPQLKESLRQNKQKVSGNKEELLERVSECMVLGGLPRCPECTGYLRYINGVYSCSGKYNDDTKSYERCPYKTEQVERIPWKNV